MTASATTWGAPIPALFTFSYFTFLLFNQRRVFALFGAIFRLSTNLHAIFADGHITYRRLNENIPRYIPIITLGIFLISGNCVVDTIVISFWSIKSIVYLKN